ncbi:glycosyltransferase family 2 protein [Yoonia maritima]|uniref:glycosyltransferase family 2 protein n=1 Tax=Yoonia maritima TaxID=1435347 RepID=UPI003735FBC1
MTAPTDIDIAICTFQRDHIITTLKSIADASVPEGLTVRVIVIDNDDTPSARVRVEACEMPFALAYIHAPGRNISIARNAALDAATAPILIFIDDDELVSVGWLDALVAEQKASGAEVVLGPARAIYPDDAPGWMRAGDHHSSRPVYVHGEIKTGYSCNALLMRTAPSVVGLRFSEKLGRSGGEDTIYFASIHRNGGKISYAPDAEVTEAVLPQRASLWWLLQRKFRFGHTHGVMLQAGLNGSIVGQLREFLRATGKCLACLGMMIITAPSAQRSISWFLRGTLHAGVAFQFLGGRSHEIYGKDQPT